MVIVELFEKQEFSGRPIVAKYHPSFEDHLLKVI